MGKEIGIDFGTTNTVVTYVDKKNNLRQLRYNRKETIIPTVIYFKSKSDYVIGRDAKKLLELNKNRAGVSNFKVSIGDTSKRYEIEADNGDTFKLKPKDVAKYYFNKIMEGIQGQLLKEFGAEGYLDRAVITVPAKFNSTEKELIRKAAREAGFEKIAIAAEPTAAAIAYEDYQGILGHDEAILVYDFGGGTFDVSIIYKEKEVFREIATNGDKTLGGNKITRYLAEVILDQFNDEYGLELPLDEEEFDEDYHGMDLISYRKNIFEIWRVANEIKESLSEELDAEGNLNLYEKDNKPVIFTVEITRKDFEKYIKNDIADSVKITLDTIREAEAGGLRKLDQIVLAGGSSNIPLIKTMLADSLKEEVLFSDDVSTLISRGAAVLAQKIKDTDSITQQKTNVQLGVAAVVDGVHGKFEVIIPENVTLPYTKTRTFFLSRDGLRTLQITYYERDIKRYPHAERITDEGITGIDTIVIDLPEGLKKDNTRVEVTFGAQEDGSLDIAVEVTGENQTKIADEQMRVSKESDLE